MHIKFCIVYVVLVFSVYMVWGQATTVDEINFENFKKRYKHKYSSSVEETLRYNIYHNNRLQMEKHNARYEMGLVSYKIAINKYSDRLNAEFAHRMLGFKRRHPTSNTTLFNAFAATKPILKLDPLPASVDWRQQGWVSSVKDQGWCGSCYAFSACGAIEGAYAKKYGQLIDCSEQNLLDCTYSSKYRNLGCDGGEMRRCFQYISDNEGMEAETTYNYMAEYTGKCQYAAADKKIGLTSYTIVATNEVALQAAVAVQPVAVALDASPASFQYYSSGIYYDTTCSSKELNHAVLLVGYGTDADGKDFWIIKNSWGTSWGEAGYMRLARNRKNHCGIANDASYPTVD